MQARDTKDAVRTVARDGDPDRYASALFAPRATREPLFALYALNVELARIAEHASEPQLGEIRLQWWRDALQGETRGDVRANPVAAALDDTIVKFRLPRQSLVDLIDARIFDLYDDPMPSLNDLEGYCGETSSSLIQLSSIVLADGSDPGTADAAGHAGVAYALTGLLRAFPLHARQGQLYLPDDILTRHGVAREDIVSGRGGPGLKGVLADLRAVARRHLEQGKALRPTIPAAAEPAFRILSLVEPYLKAMERRDYDPFYTQVDLARWRKILALWRGPF